MLLENRRRSLLGVTISEFAWKDRENYRQPQAIVGGTPWCSWLRHYATSRKVAGSIGNFHSHNSSGRTLVLSLTQPLTL